MPAKNKQGFTVNRGKPDPSGDELIVKAGELYYTWHPKGQDWQYSLERPTKRKNEHDEKVDDFRSRFDELEEDGDKDEIVSEVEEYTQELRDRLNNMPQQLQESSILNERISELEELLMEHT